METPPLENIVESIIFVSDQPVKAQAILDTLNGRNLPGDSNGKKEEAKKDTEEEEKEEKDSFTMDQVKEQLAALEEKYQDDRYPFEIRKVAKGYQFFTKKDYYPFVRKATVLRHQKRLTRAAMETLAIVAYRQPVTKAEVEFIRGVNCDYALQKLLEKKLINIVGRADAVGKPLLYATSEYFMQYFGINGVEDLPKLKEFEELMEDNMELFQQQEALKAAEMAELAGLPSPEEEPEEAGQDSEVQDQQDPEAVAEEVSETDPEEAPEVTASEEPEDPQPEAPEEDGEEKEKS